MGSRNGVDGLTLRLTDAAREIGIERGVDLVLQVLFVRWRTMTSQPSVAARGHKSWSELLTAASDEDLVAKFAPLVAVRHEATPYVKEYAEYVGVLRRLIHLVDESIGDSGDLGPTLVAEAFDIILESLGRLGRELGESTTPHGVADLTARLTVRAGDKVIDPACGNATGLLIAARSQPDVEVAGSEINSRAAQRAEMRLTLHGVNSGRGSGIWRGDAFSGDAATDADVVLVQPPWGVNFSPTQRERIQALADGFAQAAEPPGLPRGDMAWLLLALSALRQHGRAAVLLPMASTFPRCRETYEQLVRHGVVEAVILLPHGIFDHTGIASVLWLLRAPDQAAPRTSILMVDAQTLVETLDRGRIVVGEHACTEITSLVTAFREENTLAADGHIAAQIPIEGIDFGRGINPRTYLDAPPETPIIHPAPERTMLTKVSLRNFKGFGPETEIPLAPLTLVYGANSSGKSSIIQALLLFQQSKDADRIVTQGRTLNVGGFESIQHGHTARDLSISMSYGVLPAWIPSSGTPDPRLPRTISIRLHADSSGRGALSDATFRFGAHTIPLARDGDSREFQLGLDDALAVFEGLAEGTLLYPRDARQLKDGTESEQAKRRQSRIGNARRARRSIENSGLDAVTIAASGLLPGGDAAHLGLSGLSDRDLNIAASYIDRTARLVGGMSEEVAALLDSMIWLGPLRSAPQRVYDRAQTSSSSGDGSHVAIHLFDHASVVEDVNAWLVRLEIPYTLEVIPVTAGNAASLVGDLVAISLTDNRSGVVVTPADVGFGISQVLPIVVELLSRRESIITIEQPETHLHPRLQAHLADLFIDSIHDGARRNQLLVETHSEHLMLRVQRRIREGALDSESVSVIYVDTDSEGRANATRLRLDDNGDFLDEWPYGFFDDRLEELFGEF